MFLVGVFSTHITYIIIALLYVFGYGTYALNLKKHQSEKIDSSSIITTKNDTKSFTGKVNFYYHSNYKKYIKEHRKPLKKHTYTLVFKHQKLKVFDSINWISYNSTLPNITRPSPLFT